MIAANQSDHQLRSALRIPWQHRGKAISFFLAIVLLAAFLNLIWPRTYRSEGELLLRLGRENMLLDPTATLASTPILTVQQSRENELNSVIEILRSRFLLEQVAKEIGPDVVLGRVAWTPPEPTSATSSDSPNSTDAQSAVGASTAADDETAQKLADAVRKLNKMLTVEAVRKSNVIQITCDARNARLAQTIVDRLIGLFVDDYIRLNRTPGAQEFLTQQTNAIREGLHAKEDELKKLKNSTELAEPEGRRTIVVNRIGRLEDDLIQTSSQLSASEAESKELHDQLGSLPATGVLEQTTGFVNDASDGMRQQLYALQMREQEMASRFTDGHPQLKQVRQQISDAQSVLDHEPKRTQTKTGPSKSFEELKLQQLKTEPILASLRAKADRIKTQLADEKGSLEKLNADELRVAQLQREVQLAESNYRKYSDSLEQARIDRAMAEEGKSNVSIVQPATLDLKATKPNALLNILLAAIIGAIGGVALTFVVDGWNGSMHSAENGHTRMPEPVLSR
jgi:uncharacterized protein involved in exopolysaccharide biosynthesis